MKRIREKTRSFFEKMQERRKMKRMDAIWSFYGGGCFGLFPPSFYLSHSEEEIEKLKKEEIAKLKELLNDFQMRNGGKA